MPLQNISPSVPWVSSVSRLKHGTGFNGFWEVSTRGPSTLQLCNDPDMLWKNLNNPSTHINIWLIIFFFSVNTFLTSKLHQVVGRTLWDTISPWTNALRRLRNLQRMEPTRGRVVFGPWTKRRLPRWMRKSRNGQEKILKQSRRQWSIQVTKTTFY